ncbi:hypothetical protein SHIRM173S_02251 [Streptomyces hirsutus]
MIPSPDPGWAAYRQTFRGCSLELNQCTSHLNRSGFDRNSIDGPPRPRASGPDPVSWAARAFFTQPRSDSGLTPSSYATSVTVRPDGHTSSTASQRSLRIYAHSMPSPP